MSRAYEKAAKVAAEASATAHSRDIASLHDLAASQHRIAAEHASQAGLDEKVKEHRNMADMHAAAGYSASAKESPDTAKGGESLTGLQIHFGSLAKGDFDKGKNPPSWVQDEGTWDKAKKAASKTYDMDDEAFWPVVVSIYENMGGEVGGEAKARAAGQRRGAIAARRMEGKQALAASIKQNGYSLTDMQSQVAAAYLDGDDDDAKMVGCYVADIVAPEHEKGETWEAIVADGGKLYCVKFQINSDHEVKIVGEPQEVTRTSDYEYVGSEEAEAKRAEEAAGFKLAAGDFRGNQHQSAKDLADEHSTAARVASRLANKASKEANASDGDKGLHDKAAALHESARQAHEMAAAKQESAGETAKAEEHSEKASDHLRKKEEHAKAMEAAHQAAAKDAKKPKGELQAKDASSMLDCARTAANAMRSQVTLDNVIMYMPGGVHEISPTLQDGTPDGTPVTVTVLVDAEAADTLEKQRRLMAAAGKKPFFSIQHATEIAAFWPARFFWDKRLDATGSLAEGVWVEGEWSKSGKEAVEGKDFRTFSPTFFVDAVRNDADKPAKVVCQTGARANMGALENDPAFQEISPLWAKNSKAKKGKDDMNKQIVKIHDELRSKGNPTLAAVADELWARHKLKATEQQVGAALLTAAEVEDASGDGYETSNKNAHEATRAAHGVSSTMDHRAAAEHLQAAKEHGDAKALHLSAALQCEDADGKVHHDKMAAMHGCMAEHHEAMAKHHA